MVASRVLDPADAVVARDRANVRARVTDARVPVTGVDPDRAPSTLDPRIAGAARLHDDAAVRAAAIVRVADRGDRDHVDRPRDQRNVRRDHRDVAAARARIANAPSPDPDARAPNPNQDRPSLNIRTSPRIRSVRGVAKTSRTTARGVIAIERGPRRKVAEAKRSLARRSDPVISRNRNNQRKRVDPRRKATTAKIRRQNQRARGRLGHSQSHLHSIISFISKKVSFFRRYVY